MGSQLQLSVHNGSWSHLDSYNIAVFQKLFLQEANCPYNKHHNVQTNY